MQTEKDVKEPNSAPARGVLWAQGACRETKLKALKHRICLFLLLYRQIHTKINKYKIMSKYSSWRVSSKKPVGYVLSESKHLRKKLDVHHYTGCIVS